MMVKFDESVGTVAGAIFTDINSRFPHPALILVPIITLKVRQAMEKRSDVSDLPPEERVALAQEIKTSLLPVLSSLGMDPQFVKDVAPYIEQAAYRSLLQLP